MAVDRVRINEISEQIGSILRITLSRPDKANALNLETIRRLLNALTKAETVPEIRAVILTGAGRNFCGGADLKELSSHGPESVRKLLEPLKEFMTRLEKSRLISVAAVHGAARAGGLELALACDVVIAARSATFGDAHLANGLIPAGGSTVRLPRTIGLHRAKWLILSAEAISAETAREWGLVTEVVEEALLNERAEAYAEQLGRADSAAVGRVKHLLMQATNQSLETALRAEITALEDHCQSDAFRIGVARFLKTPKA